MTFSRWMNPDKLFDYLDGKLAPAERLEIEQKLTSDLHLRRQLAVAREIHRGMSFAQQPREMVIPAAEEIAEAGRAGRLGRRIATAAFALVLINVLFGLGVIAMKNRKAPDDSRELAIRQQIAASLGNAARDALPLPTFAAADVQLTAPRAEWDEVAARVTSAAETVGGSAAKGLPADDSVTVVADIPSARAPEFRQSIGATPMSPVPDDSSSAASNARTIVQVRIADGAR